MSALGAAPWLVDVSRLRSTLDALRQGLSPIPVITFGPVDLLGDRGRILASVQALLHKLEGQDLDAPVVEIEYPPEARAVELSHLLVKLQHGWERRVANKLGSDKVSCLLQLLDMRVPDFLGLLRQVDDENANSDVLAWLLDPRKSPQVATAALNQLTSFLDHPESWQQRLREAVEVDCLSLRREVIIGRDWAEEETADRLDLLICGPGFVLAIENKLWAPEHTRQTDGYWRWLSRLPVLHGGLFLSPAGRAPLSPGFRAVSYMDLLSCLLEAPAAGASLANEEQIILASYIKTLAGHVLRTELRTIRTAGGRA